jgi:hypothetical protein
MAEKKKRRLSPRQKWPKKYSMRGSFWTPDGSRIDIETDLTHNLWKDSVLKIIKYMKEASVSVAEDRKLK